MRNLKKVLALVVAVAMFASMSFVASATAYTDVASDASYADAVNLLSNLGILKGYEDGTFKPDNTVTRAEAATIMVRMLALDDEVEQGDTNFTDVPADHWASGYINVAEANGIINGMGDGTFNPEGEVTYGQIVKMIVCALGYEPVALAHGGYLGGGYLYAGSSQVTGFTKGVAGTANGAASRATVARLIYNALEVEIMDQETFSTGINGSEYKVQENKTILSEYLELEKVDGVIIETYISSATYEEGDNTVEMVVTKNYSDSNKIDYEAGEVYSFVADGTDAATLLGYTVVAYVGENVDGDDAVFAVAAKAGKNTVVTVDTDLIDELTEDTIKYYKSNNAKSTSEAEIQNFMSGKGWDVEGINNFVVNGFNVNYELAQDQALADAIIAAVDDEVIDEITLIDNDNDGDFEFVVAIIESDNANEFVVTSVEAEDDVYTFEGDKQDGSEDSFDVDLGDDDKLYTVVKDGEIVDIDAIVVGDVLTVLDDNVNVITLYVSSAVVEGTVDEVEDGTYTIAGKEYELGAISFDEDETLSAGDEGIFYVNAFGKIAYVDTVNSIDTADYVYVIDADVDTGSFGDTDYLVKVVTATGAIETLTIKSKKVDVYDADGEEHEDLKDEDAYEFVKDYEGLIRIDTTTAGEINVIYFPGYDKEFAVNDTYENANEKEYKEARNTYGVVDLAADTLVFNKDTDEEDLEDAITVSTVGKLFANGSSYQFIAYGEEDKVAEVLVAFDAASDIDAEAPVMVVTKVSDVVVDDEDTLKITGVVAGATKSVIVDPDEYKDVEVVKGNVILYAESGDYVTDVQVLFNSDDEDCGDESNLIAGGDIVLDMQDDDVSIHFGEITDKSGKKVELDDADVFYFADEVNVIVVDYTGAKVTIKSGSLSDVKKSSTSYDRFAFVKTLADAEDEISDVVVFVK